MERFTASTSPHVTPRALRALCFALLGLLAAVSASAQTATGGIRGFVKDPTGAVLAGVTVEAVSPSRIGGAAVDVSDTQGLYRLENLPGLVEIEREETARQLAQRVGAHARRIDMPQ